LPRPPPPTTYTPPLHDALPISARTDRLDHRRCAPLEFGRVSHVNEEGTAGQPGAPVDQLPRLDRRRRARRRAKRDNSPASRQPLDRKSTRLNSSHLVISYAVFC